MTRFILALMHFLGWVSDRLPRPLRLFFGRLLGRAAWLIVPKWRKAMAAENVRLALQVSESEAQLIVKRSVVRFGPMFFDVLAFPYMTRAKMERIVKWEGREYLEAAVAEGHGVVLATAHIGNWEMMAAATGLSGYHVVAVGRKQNNPAMDALITGLRSAVGVHATYKTSVLEMARMLGQGWVIGLLMDQDAGPDGLPTYFFGRPSYVPQGPAALARLKQAPIVPCVILDMPDGSYLMKCWPVLHVERSRDKEADIRFMTEQLVRWLEETITAHPELWFWLHNRWKTQPPNL